MAARRQRHDYGAEVRKHRPVALRTALVTLGTLFVGLGVLGAFLPLLPTIVFFVPNGYAQIALALFGVFLAAYLYRIPSRARR